MRFIKKLAALAAAAVLLALMTPAAVFAAPPERIAVYAQVPQDWSEPCLWAWSDDGANAFAAWPGGEMEPDPGNPGWYYCWIPGTATNIIINANEGGVQTADQKLEAKNAWITVEDAATAQISYEAKTTGEIPAYVEKFAVHARAPEGWKDLRIWAWQAPEGKNAFEAWPGREMKAGETGWYTANVPAWVNSIIVNANEGAVQTEDLSIDAAEVWVTVDAQGKAEFTYNDPDAPVAEDITVHVQAPADWAQPHLWAWSAPDGTNAFSAWPGEALQEGEDGWLTLTVPGWVNSIIVNANEGGVQTADLAVETGKDVWITVADAENAAVSYQEPAAAPAPPASGAASSTEAKPAAPAQTGGAGAAPVLILLGVAAVAAAAGAAVIVKKKKS